MAEKGTVFHFRQFSLRNERSPLKVGTDGVLLGAAVPVRETQRRIVDVGTGTGLLALMLAQRLREAQILAIEIDADAATEAADNFAASPWSDRLTLYHGDFLNYPGTERFDLILCNPPYFEQALRNPNQRKSTARHTENGGNGLSYRSLIRWAETHLSPGGQVSLILPAETEQALLRYARSFAFQPSRILRIRTTERKAVSRIIVSLQRSADITAPAEAESLTLMDADGRRSSAYNALCQDFYLGNR